MVAFDYEPLTLTAWGVFLAVFLIAAWLPALCTRNPTAWAIAWRCAPGFVFMSIVIHFYWAALCFVGDDSVGYCTALHGVHTSIGRIAYGALFAVFAACALVSFVADRHGPFLVVPQQVLLLLTGFAEVWAIVHHRFADGVERPWAFIAADQGPGLLIALAHTFGIRVMFREVAWRTN